MDRRSRTRTGFVHEHVDSGGMPIGPACFLGCVDNSLEFSPLDGGVDIGGQAGSQGIAFEDVNEDGHAADDSMVIDLN